jgi:hypothetical protein
MKVRLRRGASIGLVPMLMALTLVAFPQQSTFADTSTPECSTELNSYLLARANYLALSKPKSTDYKELAALSQKAEKERASCLRDINASFNSQLQGIRAKYAAMIKNGDKKTVASLRTQRDSEVADATLTRDNTIKNLPEIPSLPDAPTKAKK